MLDVNAWADADIGIAENSQFMTNTAVWLAGSGGSQVAPEPVTLLLVGSGLAGVAGVRRRRRTLRDTRM